MFPHQSSPERLGMRPYSVKILTGWVIWVQSLRSTSTLMLFCRKSHYCPVLGRLFLLTPPCHLRFQIICSTVHIESFYITKTQDTAVNITISPFRPHIVIFPLRTSSRTSMTVQSQLWFTPRITSGTSINPRRLSGH